MTMTVAVALIAIVVAVVGRAQSSVKVAADTPPQARATLTALIAQDSPLAFWPLNEDSGARFRDLVAGHDASASGDVRPNQVAQGPTVSSAGFYGGGTITAAADSVGEHVVAATAWFRMPRHAGADDGNLLDTGGLVIAISRGTIAVETCQSTCVWLIGRIGVADGAWHQVAVSVEGEQADLYVDGALDTTGYTTGMSRAATGGLVSMGYHFWGDINDVALLANPLTPVDVAQQFQSGACPQADGETPPDPITSAIAAPLPLHTDGRFVVDATDHRVKLAGLNWYGAEQLDHVPAGLQCQSLDAIAAHIAADGFNVVRLSWATDTWVGVNPWVPAVAVAANPQLRGWGAREVFDAVIDALARHGLLVILDNHVGRPDWCCSTADGNALWWEDYNPAHPPHWKTFTNAQKRAYFNAGQARWLAAWRTIAARYAVTGAHPAPAVVGADLRNELRGDSLLRIAPTWQTATSPVWSDWPRAATAAGNVVLQANPDLLVAVEGLAYATDLRGAALRQIHLSLSNHLIYSVHDYPFTHRGATADEIREQLGEWWGWLLAQDKAWTTPVWVGEFGTCHPDGSSCSDMERSWLPTIASYLRDGDLDWAYFSVNGTGAHGGREPQSCSETLRFEGCDDGYGLSDDTWAHDASPALTNTLRNLQPASQGPDDAP
jgi:endoglucanase